MKLFKKRGFAWCIAAIAIVRSILFGSYRSLNAQAKKVTNQFYNGVYDQKQDYTQPSINSQLDKCIDAAMGVLSITNHYENLINESSLLREARQALLDADTIGEKFKANTALKFAYDSAVSALEKVSLSESDASALESYRSTFDGAQGVIEKSLYNEQVEKFENYTISAFPAGILGGITGVTYPEYFN